MELLKKILPVFLIVCVAVVAVLGFFAMADMNSHVFSSCIGSLTGANCPIATFTLTDIAAHISAVQTLILTTLNPIIISLFILSIFLLITGLLSREDITVSMNLQSILLAQSFPSQSQLRRRQWLSLLEERDPSHAD